MGKDAAHRVSGYSRVFYLTHMEIPNFRVGIGSSLCFLQKPLGKSEFPYAFFKYRQGNVKHMEILVFHRYAMEWKQIKRQDLTYAMSGYWRRRCGLSAFDFVVRGMVVIAWYPWLAGVFNLH
jgi:hypothetical protein